MIGKPALPFAFLANTGVSGILARLKPTAIRILTYHSVSTDGMSGIVDSQQEHLFRQQIQYLVDHFDIVNLLDIQRGPQSVGMTRPRVAITFDDGYRDNYELAYPILMAYGITATVFLSTDFIDSGRPPWPTRLRYAVMRRRGSVDRPAAGEAQNEIQQKKQQWSLVTPDEREHYLAREGYGEECARDYPALTWRHIREMARGGVTFGSHTVYHSMLSRSSLSVARAELASSREVIESQLGLPCTVLAYPDGRFSEDVGTLASRLGYTLGCTQVLGLNFPQRCLGMYLRRIHIPRNQTLAAFRYRLARAVLASDRSSTRCVE